MPLIPFKLLRSNNVNKKGRVLYHYESDTGITIRSTCASRVKVYALLATQDELDYYEVLVHLSSEASDGHTKTASA